VGGRLPAWLITRARFRSTFLIILGITQVPYGIALLLSQRTTHPVQWWPGAFRQVDGVPVTFWAWVWITAGSFILATCWLRDDRLPFAVAVMLNFVWASLAIQKGFESPADAGAWGPGAIYFGISAGVLMISAWPNPIPAAELAKADEAIQRAINGHG
jgi:hypothetical protein